MSEIDWTHGIGLGVRGRMALSGADSTYALEDPRPVTQPANGTHLTSQARGEAPAATVYVRTQEGGVVGGNPPATFVERSSSGGDWYGYDVQGVAAMVQTREVQSGGVFVDAAHPHAVSLPDGRIVQVSYVEFGVVPPGQGQYTISCDVIDVDGTVTGAGVVLDRTIAFADAEKRPCVVVTESGRWLCYSWRVDQGQETAQIRCHYSDDDGDTWALGSESCLPRAIDVSSAGYTVGRIRAAESGGAVVLVLHRVAAAALVTSYRDQIVQYASRDFGLHFQVVAATDEGYTDGPRRSGLLPDVIRLRDGALIAAWVAGVDGYVYGTRLGSPYDSCMATTPTLISGSAVRRTSAGSPALATTLGNLSLAEAAGGEIYALSAAGTDSRLQLVQSTDGGRSWSGLGRGSILAAEGSTAWRGEATTLRPAATALASLGGRLVIVCLGTSGAATYRNSIRLIGLGGPSTVTLPPLDATADRRSQVTWDHDWLSFAPPSAASTTTATGSPVEAFTATRLELTTSAASQGYYETTLDAETAAIATNGVIVKAGVQVVSGGSLSSATAGLRVTVGDTADTYMVTVRMTSASARVYDEIAGAAVGSDISLTTGTDYDWLVALAAGTVQVWTRPRTFAGRVEWTQQVRGSVSDGGPAVGADRAIITYGHIDSGSAESYWYQVSAVHDYLTGTQLDRLQENPADLLGMPYSAQGVTVGSARTVLESRGATIRGDVVEVQRGSTYGLDRLSRGGPRRPARFNDDADTVLVYKTAAGTDSSHETDVLVVAAAGANIPKITIEGVSGAGATTLFDGWLTTNVAAALDGDVLYPDGTDVDTPTFAYGELTNQYVLMDDGGASTKIARKIDGNRDGHWADASGNKPKIFLSEAPATGMASSGTARIIPTTWAVVIDLRGAEYETIRVTIPSASGAVGQSPEGYWQVGELIVGHLLTSAYHPSWGNRVTEEFPSEIFDSRDQQRDGVELAPIRRRFRMGYVDGIRQYNVIGPDFDQPGDYFRVSTNGASEGMGQVGLVLHNLGGLIRRTRGGLEPVVYLPRISEFDGSQTQLFNRRAQVALAYIDSPIERTRVVGPTMYGDLIRGDILELTEVT